MCVGILTLVAPVDCIVEVDPDNAAWSAIKGERLHLQAMDMDNIAILNSVMAQVLCADPCGVVTHNRVPDRSCCPRP